MEKKNAVIIGVLSGILTFLILVGFSFIVTQHSLIRSENLQGSFLDRFFSLSAKNQAVNKVIVNSKGGARTNGVTEMIEPLTIVFDKPLPFDPGINVGDPQNMYTTAQKIRISSVKKSDGTTVEGPFMVQIFQNAVPVSTLNNLQYKYSDDTGIVLRNPIGNYKNQTIHIWKKTQMPTCTLLNQTPPCSEGNISGEFEYIVRNSSIDNVQPELISAKYIDDKKAVLLGFSELMDNLKDLSATELSEMISFSKPGMKVKTGSRSKWVDPTNLTESYNEDVYYTNVSGLTKINNNYEYLLIPVENFVAGAEIILQNNNRLKDLATNFVKPGTLPISYEAVSSATYFSNKKVIYLSFKQPMNTKIKFDGNELVDSEMFTFSNGSKINRTGSTKWVDEYTLQIPMEKFVKQQISDDDDFSVIEKPVAGGSNEEINIFGGENLKLFSGESLVLDPPKILNVILDDGVSILVNPPAPDGAIGTESKTRASQSR